MTTVLPLETPKNRGLVIASFGHSVAVEEAAGQVILCHLRRNQPQPVVGDQVLLDNKIIVTILPRRSVFQRGERNGKIKTLAANVDLIGIVMAPIPPFSAHLLDRYLVAAALLDIPPLIILNKSDLLVNEFLEKTHLLLKPYAEAGYIILYGHTQTEHGLAPLDAAFKNKTVILLGPSGVGKSSIIKALAEEETIVIGEVSDKGMGKHTTTANRLYHLKDGGQIIDSPGVRDFSLWPIEEATLLLAFKEFVPYLTGCQFRDCRHYLEPGCAVQTAVNAGKITPTRFSSYHALLNDPLLKIKKSYEK